MPELAQGRLRGNPVPRPHMDKITLEVALMPLQLALAHQRTVPQLLLALELQPGEGQRQTHPLLDQLMTHPHQVEHMTIFQLHMVEHPLQQLQLQHQDTETKRQHQRWLTAQINSKCGTIGLTRRHQGMMLPRQPQAHRHLVHMEVVMMHRRQLQGPETAQDTLTTMSKMR